MTRRKPVVLTISRKNPRKEIHILGPLSKNQMAELIVLLGTVSGKFVIPYLRPKVDGRALLRELRAEWRWWAKFSARLHEQGLADLRETHRKEVAKLYR